MTEDAGAGAVGTMKASAGGGTDRGAGVDFWRRWRLVSGAPRSEEVGVAGFLRIVRMASGGLPTKSLCMYVQATSFPLPSTFLNPKLLSCRWKLFKLL